MEQSIVILITQHIGSLIVYLLPRGYPGGARNAEILYTYDVTNTEFSLAVVFGNFASERF